MTLFFTAIVLTLFLLPFYKKLLFFIGSLEYNYKNQFIPISFGGLIFTIEAIIFLGYDIKINYYYWVSLLIITAIGTVDDLFGDKKIKGIKGHFNSFFRGKITSGLIKAIFGGIIAIFVSFFIANSYLALFTHFLLISLMINLINLFDLRPGRALKVFFILFLVLSLFTPFLADDKIGFILLGILLVVFFYDLRAKIMLGDSGANLIGLHLGIWYSLYLSLFWQWVIIFSLIIIHVYTEKKSLSKLIEENWLLRKIDLIGRKGMV